MKKIDIAIIGAGSAGLTAARLAAKFGVQVVLFEKHRIGGDCLYTGCVPSKSLITVAREVYNAQQLRKYGVTAKTDIKYAQIKKAIESSIHHIHDHEDSTEVLEKFGISVVNESVTFTSKNILTSKSGKSYKFRKAIIASGSSPRKIDIPGLDSEHVVTSDTIWDMKLLPKQLIVLGGGPIGLELAQAYAMLGSQVTIVERSDTLLGNFDKSVAAQILKGLEESGVKILYESGIENVKQETKLKVRIKTGTDKKAKSQTYTADKILVAVGRVPNVTGLDLDTIKIEYSDRGIKVDDKFRTNVKNIYAVGDCKGGPFFTHLAGEHGATALTHALFGVKRSVNWDALPWAFFTTPEVGHVGASKKDLESKDVQFTEEILGYDEIDKAIAEHHDGSVRVLLDKKRKVLGATIVGENASELIGYYAYLMANGEKIDKLAVPIQAYPTYAMAMRRHASDIQVKAFTNTIIPRILLKLRGY